MAVAVANVQCRISFAIEEPLPERGWYTIEPKSPYPPIDAFDIVIDAYRNAAPPIEIRGTHVFGDGLVLRGTFVTLTGLSIDGFFDNGVVVDQKNPSRLLIENNNIGCDPSGAPVPNGLRGIAVVRAYGTIRSNTISGNSRSGIFVTSDAPLKILDNRITNNGASGIYLGPKAYYVEMQGNVISGNHDFAVGIDSNATRIAVRDNAMFDNGAPLDIGMDGPDVRVLPFASRIEPRPAVRSAVYDAATGDTVVTLAFNPVDTFYNAYTLYVFASRGFDRAGRAEAETFLGTVSTHSESTPVFRAHADLRGQIITALTLRSTPFFLESNHEDTSELSDGVVVR
jgi:parallel beta-helix repeat protein